MKKIMLVAINLIIATCAKTQTVEKQSANPDSLESSTFLQKVRKNIRLDGYMSAYYALDNDRINVDQETQQRALSFIAPKRDQFGIDIASLTAAYGSEKARGIFTVQYGDVVQLWLKPVNIQEANFGFKVRKNVWVDAGYFITHVGTEAFFPKDNYLSSIAVGTFFLPLTQSGVKISWDVTSKLSAQFHLINGFSTIHENDRNKSLGIQLSYRPTEKLNIVYNNIFGKEQDRTRLYNNVFIRYIPNKHWEALWGGDLSLISKSGLEDTNATGFGFHSELTVHRRFDPHWSMTVRAEYFNDVNAVLDVSLRNQKNGLNVYALTVGGEYKIISNTYFRIESRYIESLTEYRPFGINGANPRKDRLELIITSGITF